MYNSDFGLKSKRSKVKPLKSCRVIANILVKGCVTCPKCYERLQINFPEEKQNKSRKPVKVAFIKNFCLHEVIFTRIT